jgi:hypothetical protein
MEVDIAPQFGAELKVRPLCFVIPGQPANATATWTDTTQDGFKTANAWVCRPLAPLHFSRLSPTKASSPPVAAWY